MITLPLNVTFESAEQKKCCGLLLAFMDRFLLWCGRNRIAFDRKEPELAMALKKIEKLYVEKNYSEVVNKINILSAYLKKISK